MACKFIGKQVEQTQLCSDGVGAESQVGWGAGNPTEEIRETSVSQERGQSEKAEKQERVLKGRRGGTHPIAREEMPGAAGARALWETLHCIYLAGTAAKAAARCLIPGLTWPCPAEKSLLQAVRALEARLMCPPCPQPFLPQSLPT